MRRLSMLLLAACSSSSRPSTPPVDAAVGVFHLTLRPDTARLVVAGADGRALLDGLDASGDVGAPQSANDDAPPLTGFAVREVTTSYKMLYGSFRIDDDAKGPWRVGRSAAWAGGDAPIALKADDGATIATLTAAPGADSGHLVVTIAPGDGPERRFSWGFRCDGDDAFLGFGEQTWGVNARGETIPIWVSEEGLGKDLTTDDPGGAWFVQGRRHSTSLPLPMWIARRGYAAFVETDRLSTFAMCSERDDTARMQFELPAKLHLFWGPSPKEAITGMSAELGRPRVPPAFAFAPWNDAIKGSANVRRVAKKLRDLGVPSSVVWTEDWRGGTDAGNGRYVLQEEWDVDRTLYPDFEAVASDLHAAGFKWLVYFNTFVDRRASIWKQAAPEFVIKDPIGQPLVFDNAKFDPSSMIDLTDPKAVDFVVGKLKGAIALGADGWMGDYGEWLPTNAALASGEDAAAVHNRYPLLWLKTQRQALDEAIAQDGVERLAFVRSGWLGAAPLVDVFWPGDQRTDFEVDDGMPIVVPMGIGAGIAGLSTFGSDIAGYQSATNPPSTKELFFRWTELGAWSPVMRTHHGTHPDLEWNWEKDDETTQHWAQYAKLHVALAPYMMALAAEAHTTGVPMWRALALEHPDDARAWSVADEVLLGERVLVAPVQADGARARDVYLPKGRWFPWTGGAAIDGGATVNVPVDLGEIAVFVRAGGIVPTYPDGVMTLVKEPSSAPGPSGDDRFIVAFGAADGQLVEAGGLSYALKAGDAAPGAPLAAAWNGATLAACDAATTAPCVELGADGVRAHVVGPGALVVTRGGANAATLTVTGGSPTRKLVLDVRV